MPTDVEPVDWKVLDSWWASSVQPASLPSKSNETRTVANGALRECWNAVDPWWETYTTSSSLLSESTTTRVTDTDWLTDSWKNLDSWWNAFAETGHEIATQLTELFERSNDEWANSDAPFSTDPLAADLTGERIARGPLRPSNEVAWSRWLGRLLGPSTALVTELFDVQIGTPPFEVVWEDRLSKREGGFRRPDILLCGADRGVSIEVKLEDENYRKTPETARLVERHYSDKEWSHVLLLPKRKRSSLESIVRAEIDRDTNGQVQVQWDDPGPIDVVYWRDVTAAIRAVLRRGDIVDDHWAANAYVFCGLVEQQLLNFQPQSVLEHLADPVNVVDTVQPVRIADTLEQQLTYLSERIES
ncbi:hypothetical protein ACLI4Z_19175 [Natrialbaceae archaeon A-arb3/5]